MLDLAQHLILYWLLADAYAPSRVVQILAQACTCARAVLGQKEHSALRGQANWKPCRDQVACGVKA